MICSVVTNLVGAVHGKKGRFKPSKPKDFMPTWDPEGILDKPAQSLAEMKSVLMSLAASGKGKIRQGKPQSMRQKREERRKS